MRFETVFAHEDGVTYVAVDDDGQWFRWPAVADGWRERRRCSEAEAESAEELTTRLAHLAQRLSGVPV